MLSTLPTSREFFVPSDQPGNLPIGGYPAFGDFPDNGQYFINQVFVHSFITARMHDVQTLYDVPPFFSPVLYQQTRGAAMKHGDPEKKEAISGDCKFFPGDIPDSSIQAADIYGNIMQTL